MRQRLASLISDVLNPFLVSFFTILLLAWKSTDTIDQAVKWALVSLVLSVLPVLLLVLYLVRTKRVEGVFTARRRQRNLVYALVSILGALSTALVWAIDAPRPMAVTFSAGLAGVVVFMLVNLLFKISLHAGFISAAAAVLTIMYGGWMGWIFLLLLPVAWARVELKAHSLAQVAAGALVAGGITALVFKAYGLW